MTQLATQTKAQRIEDRLNVDRAGQIQVSNRNGGMLIQTMSEVMEVAKLMALSDIAVPRHLRENPGACLAICIRAHEWRMNPYAVADKSYVVNDRLSFESQLIHAVIEQRAPLQGRLRCRYSGEDGKRRCTVYAKIQGEEEPFEFQSAEFDKIQPKNSPLWKTKPDLQLFYNASRDWARMYFPDVILGVYAEDEIERDAPAASAAQLLNKQIDEDSAPASQQTAVHSLPADESTPSVLSSRPADTANDSSVGRREAEGEEHRQPEAPEEQQPAPEQSQDSAAYDTWEDLHESLEALAMDRKVSAEVLSAAVKKSLVAIGKVGKGPKTTLEERRGIYEAAVAGRGNFALVRAKPE